VCAVSRVQLELHDDHQIQAHTATHTNTHTSPRQAKFIKVDIDNEQLQRTVMDHGITGVVSQQLGLWGVELRKDEPGFRAVFFPPIKSNRHQTYRPTNRRQPTNRRVPPAHLCVLQGPPEGGVLHWCARRPAQGDGGEAGQVGGGKLPRSCCVEVKRLIRLVDFCI
jgi:hypothetical protein